MFRAPTRLDALCERAAALTTCLLNILASIGWVQSRKMNESRGRDQSLNRGRNRFSRDRTGRNMASPPIPLTQLAVYKAINTDSIKLSWLNGKAFH